MWYDETRNSRQSGTNWGEVTLEEESDIPTNGLDIWISSDCGLTLGGEDGTSVLKWESQGISDVTFEADENSAPTLSTNENGVTSLLFDGTSDVMEFDGVDYNGKSELTMIVATNYTGEKIGNPEGDWTSGDKYSALYVTETGSGWGGLFVSPYQDWVAARFGTGQQFCNIKYVRPEEINRTSVTAAVKSGSTEKMYVDGENVVTKEGTAETTTNIGSTMYVGKSICAGKDNFFQGTISEILIYDRALADAEIEQISTYLNQKYVSALDSITVSGPTKTEYKIGEELDLAGLEVTAHYSDGSEVAVEDYEVSGFDSSTAGEKTVTVTYEGKIAAFTVNVLPDDDTDKTDLEIAVELAGLLDLTDYVEAGQQEFTDALAAANEVLNDGDAMQEETDEAWNALVAAMENLRLKANKDALEALLNAVAELDLNRYTEESVQVFRVALASAQAVFSNETLSVDDQKPDNNNQNQNDGTNDANSVHSRFCYDIS